MGTEREKQEIIDACQMMISRYTRDGGPMWESTMNALLADPVDAAEELRKTLNVGKIMHNRAQCPDCHQIIQSMTGHDHQSCKCGGSFVDGGSLYCRMGGKVLPIPMIENWPWLKYLEK